MLVLLISTVAAINSWLCPDGTVLLADNILAIIKAARLSEIPFKRFGGGYTGTDTPLLVSKGWINTWELDMGYYAPDQRGPIRIVLDNNHNFLGVIDHRMGITRNGFGLCAELRGAVSPYQGDNLSGLVLHGNDLANLFWNYDPWIANLTWVFCFAYRAYIFGLVQLRQRFARRLVARATCSPVNYFNINTQYATTPVADEFITVDLDHYNFIGRLSTSNPNRFYSYSGKCYRTVGEGMQCTVIRRVIENNVYTVGYKSTCSLGTLGNTSKSGNLLMSVKQPGIPRITGDCSNFLSIKVV